MYTNQNYDSYRHEDITIQSAAATPYEILCILYSRLIDELACAKSHIKAKRYQHKMKSINKCVQIINILICSLDGMQEDDLTQRLITIYEYCVYQLYEASATLAEEKIEEVEKVLILIYDNLQKTGQENGLFRR